MVTCPLSFFLSHEDDLLYNKVATQLHTYASTYYDASNVLNGNAATCMRTVPIGPNNPDKVQYAIHDQTTIYTCTRSFQSKYA